MVTIERHFSSIWKLLLLIRVCHSLSSSPRPKTVIIVGGGVGGLATAARIASSSDDAKVLILEKNSELGGRCGSFTVSTDRGDFRHERGPSLLLLKDVYLDLFTECSSDKKGASDYGLEMEQCSPAYQVVFDDGECIELGFPATDTALAIAESKSRRQMDSYEADGATKWDEYMQTMAAYLNCGLPNFIKERLDLASFPAFLYEALRDRAKAWPLKPHSDVLDAIFDSTKMKALASFQNLYVGLEPYRNDNQIGGGVLRKTAPAVFGLLAAIELHPTNGGVFAPIGGFNAVTRAMERLATDHGVEIQCDSTVTKVTKEGVHVLTKEGGSQFLPSDLVLINADLPFATETLLKEGNENRETYDWNDKFDYSSGVIAFHWSIDKELSDLNTHNVFLAAENDEQSKASWRALRSEQAGGATADVEPFNFYVHRASKTDSTAAPTGCDAILVLVPCQTLKRNADWASLPRDEAIRQYKQQFDDEVISRSRQAVLKRLAAIELLENLEQHIIQETVDTPGTYADQYNVAAGTPFALSHGFGQLSLTRPGAQSSLPNTLFVGASSRPGNGVPLVLIGAKQAAEKALKKLASL
jgi:phytoene desaturase (3,4-didehydrolycopene-forming)